MRALALLAAAMTLAVVADAAAFDAPQSRLFDTRDFKLESGVVLPELVLAYETYGSLAADGRNAVLVTHGYTSSHHAAGRYGAIGAAKGLKAGDVGSWDKLIGPGKAIDTSKLFVVSSNMLGSSYGSTGPASINPRTGKPYGPDFPRHTVADIVRAQKALLDHLGVKHLVAVAGPSLRWLPGVSVGGDLSGLHARHRAGRHRAEELGRTRRHAEADRAAGRRSQLEWRLVL